MRVCQSHKSVLNIHDIREKCLYMNRQTLRRSQKTSIFPSFFQLQAQDCGMKHQQKVERPDVFDLLFSHSNLHDNAEVFFVSFRDNEKHTLITKSESKSVRNKCVTAKITLIKMVENDENEASSTWFTSVQIIYPDGDFSNYFLELWLLYIVSFTKC